MTIVTTRTDSHNTDFKTLSAELEAELKILDGNNHEMYASLNAVGKLDHVIIAFNYENHTAIACGAMKAYEAGVMEIKRMYVLPELRGKGVAGLTLSELELWCKELGFNQCILETGKNQPEAIQFYTKRGYKSIDNFGKYKDSENSVCFEKLL